MARASKGRSLAALVGLASAALALRLASRAFFASGQPKRPQSGSTTSPAGTRVDSPAMVQPKRPLSGYMLWLSEERPKIVEALNTKSVPKVAKEGGVRWGALGAAEKAPFEKQAQELKAAYNEALEAFKAQGGVVESKTRKAKEGGKKAKDPNRPKRAATSYMGWVADNRASIKASLPEGANGVTYVAKKAGEMWRQVSAADRVPYEEAYQADKARYAKELEAYER